MLLKNEKKLLPLSKDIATIAVIGPNAYATETLLGKIKVPGFGSLFLSFLMH